MRNQKSQINSNSRNSSIRKLSQNLFTKFKEYDRQCFNNDSLSKLANQYHNQYQYQCLQTDIDSGKTIGINHLQNGKNDTSVFATMNILSPVQNLLSKANVATKQGQCQLKKARKVRRKDEGTFLTGTNIYDTLSSKIIQPSYNVQVPEGPTHIQILKQLIQSQDKDKQKDDLFELRKMLKQTGESIQDCKKKVFETHKTISAAYNYSMLNRLQSQRKIASLSKITNKYR